MLLQVDFAGKGLSNDISIVTQALLLGQAASRGSKFGKIGFLQQMRLMIFGISALMFSSNTAILFTQLGFFYLAGWIARDIAENNPSRSFVPG